MRAFSRTRRLFHTLYDLGFKSIFRRLLYEFGKQLDHFLLWTPYYSFLFSRRPYISTSLTQSSSSSLAWRTPDTYLRFSFLNTPIEISLPMVWEHQTWSRLWQFNLHYFDWAVSWSRTADQLHSHSSQAIFLQYLIDDWIHSNPVGSGDGWHSYTISLRLRNWIYLFKRYPDLASKSRIESLWLQLLWLDTHLEYHHGGNHLLENLISVCLTAVNFSGSYAHLLLFRHLSILEEQLDLQLLSDGGHEERSFTYHNLLLKHLVELAITLRDQCHLRLDWLDRSIQSMYFWTSKIISMCGTYPRFNDSPIDTCPHIPHLCREIEDYLGLATHSYPSAQPTLDLAHTGWTFLSSKQNINLIFKCGLSSPPYLAAHAHSDILSFDLFIDKFPVIAEAGTSTYQTGPLRSFERSTRAHNTLEIRRFLPSGKTSEWIQAIDVWSSFRAGRKAKPLYRGCGSSSLWSWCYGSHDGFSFLSANHFRFIAVTTNPLLGRTFVVLDFLFSLEPIEWRMHFHTCPHFFTLLKQGWHFEYYTSSPSFHACVKPSYYSLKLRSRLAREAYCYQGNVSPHERHLSIFVFSENELPSPFYSLDPVRGHLSLSPHTNLRWTWSSITPNGIPPTPSICLD